MAAPAPAQQAPAQPKPAPAAQVTATVGPAGVKVEANTSPAKIKSPTPTVDTMSDGLTDEERQARDKKYLDGFHFNPITAEKQVLIQRTQPTPASSGDTLVAQLSYQFGTGKGPSVDTEGLKGILKDVEKMELDRKEKKKSLQECNDKLANYIEKTRFLEEQIRKLVDELKALRENWGKETARIRTTMDKPLSEARDKLEKSENDKGELEVRIELLEGDINNKKDQLDDEVKKRAVAKDKADKQQQKLSDYESELELLKRKKDFLDTEKDKLKKDNDKLKEEIKKLKGDLENESINHVKAENQANVLKEELDFLKAVWDLERKELEKLLNQNSTGENREYWKSEIEKLFRELNDQFDNQLVDYRSDLNGQFESKLQMFEKAQGLDNNKISQIRDDVQRLKNENDKLKDKLAQLEPKVSQLESDVSSLQKQLEDLKTEYDREVAKLTAELNASKSEIDRLMAEMRKLFDQKIALELEITQYRKMLDMDSGRKTAEDDQPAKKKVAEKTQAKKPKDKEQSGKGELVAKTVYEKKAKGNVEIAEVTLDSRCITLGNTGTAPENISNWKIVRDLDYGRQTFEYKLPDAILEPGKSLKIFAKNNKPKDDKVNLELDKPSWGLGAYCMTTLVNEGGEEKATYLTKTVYENQ